MRVLVCGGRDYGENEAGSAHRIALAVNERLALRAKLDAIHAKTPITALGHGACGWNADIPSTFKSGYMRGADAIADEWACEHGIVPDRFPAHWTSQKGGAGPRRNQNMLNKFKADLLVVAPGGRGTADTVRKAKAMGVPVEPVE